MTYQTREQWLATPLGADGRAALRSAIKAHDGWSDYRAARAISLDGMTTADLVDAALALGIDIGSVTGKHAEQDAGEHHKPRPYDAATMTALRERCADAILKGAMSNKDASFVTSVFNTINAKQDGRATEAQHRVITRALTRSLDRASSASSDASSAAATHTPPTPATATTEAHNMTPATAPTGDAAQQLAGLLTQLAGQSVNPETVARIVDERITAALKTIPSVKIECKGADGQSRAVDGHQHPLFKALLTAACSRDANGRHPNIWIAGPAGSGKTHAVEQVAHAMGLSFHFNGAIANAFELLGFIDAGGTYHRTAFREAFENGGAYLFDEVDGSDNSAILALNAALANGACQFPDGMVKRHPDAVIMASANTHGLGATAEYVGRARIDGAFLDRFGVRFNWTYDTALEVAISGNEAFARRVIAARERARAAGLKVLITPRASQAGAALISAGMSSDEAAGLTYLANLSDDQRRIVEGR